MEPTIKQPSLTIDQMYQNCVIAIEKGNKAGAYNLQEATVFLHSLMGIKQHLHAIKAVENGKAGIAPAKKPPAKKPQRIRKT